MPPREDLILFLDLETTGTDENKDDIIEVGLVMMDATKDDYPELGSFSRVLLPDDKAFVRMMDNKIVREMHQANGLLADIMAVKDLMAEGESNFWAFQGNLIRYAEPDIMAWLKTFTGGDTTHIPYGGSGVGHFDRKFIRAQLPTFDKAITHWSYDVGVLRRSFQKAGAKYYSDLGKTHRAIDDARVHADEWRYYQKVIRGY